MFCCHTCGKECVLQNMALSTLPLSRNFKLCFVKCVLVCLVQVTGVDEESLKYFHLESPLYHVLLQKSFFAKRNYVCSPVDEQGLKYFPRFHRHCSRHQVQHIPSTKYQVQPNTIHTISALGTLRCHSPHDRENNPMGLVACCCNFR